MLRSYLEDSSPPHLSHLSWSVDAGVAAGAEVASLGGDGEAADEAADGLDFLAVRAGWCGGS